MKYLIMVLCLVIFGCENSYKEASFPVKPRELDDCKFYSLSNTSTQNIIVVRCPNSQTSTTYLVGKHYETTMVYEL